MSSADNLGPGLRMAEVVREAGAILAGGHTIRDDEPKYGLAVVGTVHPNGIWPKSGAKPGDALFLTKALGTGIVLQAQRDGHAPPGALDAAVVAMRTLNRAAADALRPSNPNAVTDVTGFGLLGHAYEMAEGLRPDTSFAWSSLSPSRPPQGLRARLHVARIEAVHLRQTERCRGLAWRSFVDDLDADLPGIEALAVTQRLLDRADHEYDQRQDLPNAALQQTGNVQPGSA